ncbi:hypothetical protein C8R47DRAFT_170432 [Mycena vitilis]|nr:hypothetical protein C8R47DRAFT_170432 [Mycena vitilis]
MKNRRTRDEDPCIWWRLFSDTVQLFCGVALTLMVGESCVSQWRLKSALCLVEKPHHVRALVVSLPSSYPTPNVALHDSCGGYRCGVSTCLSPYLLPTFSLAPFVAGIAAAQAPFLRTACPIRISPIANARWGWG